AGVAGVASGTVAQSGISKQLDAQSGNKLLTSIAQSLARAERAIAEYAMLCLRGVTPTREEAGMIDVVYPARFELFSAGELIDGLRKLQVVLAKAGEAPEIEAIGIRSIVRQLFLGLADSEYEALDQEIDQVLEAKARIKEPARKLAGAGITDYAEAIE